MHRRVVITGMGVVAPGDPGTKAFWERVVEGRTATRTVSHFDPARFRSQIAAECDFDPVREGLLPREIRRMDRSAQFAVVCTAEALADSGLAVEDVPPGRIGVSVGTAVGCTIQLDEEYRVLSDGGHRWLVDHSYAVPHMYDFLVPSSLAAEVAWKAGAEGPARVISAGCTSGIDAVGHACELIREGSADVMIAGAAEAPISPITFACFDAIKATSNRNDDPEHALRPFDSARNGFVLGEGGAILVLEELEHAVRRRAHCYAEIVGFASRSNAFHMTGLRPDGREMAEAITSALNQARLPPGAVDYVNAHGTATRQNDRHETAAVKHALGAHAYRTAMSSIKAVVGHSLGGIGAIEIAATALAIEHRVVPPTANLTDPDPELDLDYVPLEARSKQVDVALTVGSGFGGFQSAMVLARPPETAAA
ncbi:beta-ketoacyl-[acyl-carrier-protein] synthase family protein [Actinomadura harenae]|uniref:Beta-ketoacyl-[acyl-carrier-protein] synthase family protein n=1 Tax=Actinomadura harenae TaxID=2483351 RepID=A0A3M2M0J2_9ACTN|nr:beta-ketoacyl-[acyl-carrier-protein] synthase family protein [Actinomadura harenae]RMI43171.1 beta-ketoacyl-[acyl-carrier-protein] synthase family protein [Actinomadura harenae]